MDSIPTVGVLVFSDGKVLLVKHGESASHLTGAYGIPAGRLEEGEIAIQAAVRELQEETGLRTTIKDLDELPIHLAPVDIPRSDGTVKRFSIKVFLCRKYTGKLQSSDEATPEWVTLDKLDKLSLIVNTKRMIEEGRNYV